MAFNILNFAPFANQSNRGSSPQVYTYRTADPIATLLAANYFAEVQYMLDVDDTILIDFVDASLAPTKYEGRATLSVGIDVTGLITVFDITEGKRYFVTTLADVASASVSSVTANISGRISKITAVLGGAISVANSALTFDIGGVAIGGSAITVAFAGSTLGTSFSVLPSGAVTAANGLATAFVVPGSVINATSDGGSTSATTTPLYIVYEITKAVPNEIVLNKEVAVAATTAGTYYVISPIAGTVVAIRGTVDANPGANTTLTGNIMAAGVATAITNGVVTYPAGATAGNQYEAFPSAANAVSAGQVIRLNAANTATTPFNSYVQIVIRGN